MNWLSPFCVHRGSKLSSPIKPSDIEGLLAPEELVSFPAIGRANDLDNQFHLAFSRKLAKLAFMQFMTYSYYWRFTYRLTVERGAGV